MSQIEIVVTPHIKSIGFTGTLLKISTYEEIKSVLLRIKDMAPCLVDYDLLLMRTRFNQDPEPLNENQTYEFKDKTVLLLVGNKRQNAITASTNVFKQYFK